MNGPVLPDPILPQSPRTNDIPDIRSSAGSPHQDRHQDRSLGQYFCIEVFAGSGKLTAALRSLGLRDSFGVDLKLPDHLRSPIVKYDLLKPDHVKLVQDLIASEFCIYVHFAPPCGTSSRARLIQRKGRWNPPIVRTERHPDGIPDLTGSLKARVQAANELYQVTCFLVEFCLQHKKYFSVENPGRSFMWATKPFVQLLNKFPLYEVLFHHCRYGSSRRKLTKFLHNIPTFQQLELMCDNQHQHEPWGQDPAGHWRTSEETTYPWELCRAIAAKLATQLEKDGISCTPPVFALQEASLNTMRAATDLQPRRGLPPMVPEFKAILPHPTAQPLPPCARKLSTHPGGSGASVNNKVDSENKVTIGVHFNPEEFVQKALEVGHPTRLRSFFPDEMEEVVKHCLNQTPARLSQDRTEEIKRWIHLKQSLASEETSNKELMSDRRKDILGSKNLALFNRLLKDAGHGDVDLVKQLAEGFDLTGSLPESNVFSRKVRPAAMSCEDLRRIADMSRESMLQMVKSSGDADLDSQLYAATMKEVSKGFLIGPINPEDLPSGSTLTRRFGVFQKNKTRPIDDYKASFVNSSVSQTETATVHTVDHVASMIACILRQSETRSLRPELVAKTWDLADAYKQIPLSDQAFSQDAYLVVFCPATNKAEVFQQKVLPFGSVASVTAFLRVAHGIWKLGNKLLKLMWTSCFDDFFSITNATIAKHTDLVIAAMFDLLGWKLSVDKLVDYNTICKVLGMEFDFRMSGAGLTTVNNTADRVRELCEQLDSILELGKLKKSDGERLRGRLQFASGQLFGRSARNNLRVLSKHISSNRLHLCNDTVTALNSLRHQLRSNLPRTIRGPMSDHIHIYVDASFDLENYSGVGGVAYSSDGTILGYFSEEISKPFILAAMSTDQHTMIQELEMLALLIAVSVWCPGQAGKRMVAFTDSESVRGSFLKTWSGNDPSSKLLRQIFLLEEAHSCHVWLERVPSQSNPSDFLSRSQVAHWFGHERTRVDTTKLWEQSATCMG